MQPSSCLPQMNANGASNDSTFWSNGGFRKRKAAVTDLDERANPKVFVTEEKMVKEMRTLTLDLAASQSAPSLPIDEELLLDEGTGNSLPEVEKYLGSPTDDLEGSRFEFHPLLQDSLKNDDLQDPFLNKLCELERRKFTMQIVPYVPIHPAQFFTNTTTTTTDDDDTAEKSSSSSLVSEENPALNDDQLFKRPSLPTAYTVEEPSDGAIKRGPAMKRSFSQSNQYNTNLSVTEMRNDTKDDSAILHSPSPYFIVEPAVSPLIDSMSDASNSSLSSNGPSVRITEYVDNPTLTTELVNGIDDDDIDMQSVASSDTGDKMDDD